MFIAREKKRTNIAEYILYMWHIEDVMRGFGLDIRKVADWVNTMGLEPDKAAEMTEWYDNIIELMKNDGVTGKGHIRPIVNEMAELNELHLYLLYEKKDPDYMHAAAAVAEDLAVLRTKSGDVAGVSDVELAFNALYGKLLLRMQHKEISGSTDSAMNRISAMLARLARAYETMEKEEK